MSQQEHNVTRFFYSNRSQDEQPRDITALLSQVSQDTKSVKNKKAVCVIENISPMCMERLGSAWGIDPVFFANYASNPPQSELWGWCDWKLSSTPPTQEHLDGVYEYHDVKLDMDKLQRDNLNYCKRHIFQEMKWPVNISTRISYCKPLPDICEYKLSSCIEKLA